MFEHWVPSEWRCLGRFSVCGLLEEVCHWGGGGRALRVKSFADFHFSLYFSAS